MKKEFTYFVIFAIGTAVGSVASMKYFKTKYERIADEEIESVKKSFTQLMKKSDILNKKTDSNPKNNSNSISDNTKGKETLNKVVSKLDYTSFSKSTTKEEVENDKPEGDLPYIIPPEQVGEDDYECNTYTLYSDGVLTDELNDVVEEEDLAYLIGSRDVFKHIDDYGNGAVYVRNDFLGTDFEIIRCLEAYNE